MAKLLKKAKVYFVIGGPGAGKETVCRKLAADLELNQIAIGEVLRKEIQADSEIGQKVKGAVEKGELVQMATIIQLLKDIMIKEAATSKGFLISGFPKEGPQAVSFEKEVTQVQKLIHIKVSEETMKARAAARADEARIDDTEEALTARISVYNANLKGILDHYNKKKKVCEVDGEGTLDEVQALVKSCLEGKKK